MLTAMKVAIVATILFFVPSNLDSAEVVEVVSDEIENEDSRALKYLISQSIFSKYVAGAVTKCFST